MLNEFLSLYLYCNYETNLKQIVMNKVVKGIFGEVIVENLISINKIPKNVTLINKFDNCWCWYNDNFIFFRNTSFDEAKFYKCKKELNLLIELKNLV